VLVRFDDIASFIVNANHGIMRPAEKLRVTDCIRGYIRPGVPEVAEWQRITPQTVLNDQ
jgi:hypothetical protein